MDRHLYGIGPHVLRPQLPDGRLRAISVGLVSFEKDIILGFFTQLLADENGDKN